MLLDCQSIGTLLALAHEFNMPALAVRMRRLLMLPRGFTYIEDQRPAKFPREGCSDLMKVRWT